MDIYKIMIIVGAILWVLFTIIYVKKYNEGVKARKWWGMGAYFGLALFTGGLLETFHHLIESTSTMWVMVVVVVFTYVMAKFYILDNIRF